MSCQTCPTDHRVKVYECHPLGHIKDSGYDLVILTNWKGHNGQIKKNACGSIFIRRNTFLGYILKVFTHEDLENVPTLPPNNVPNMNNIIIHEQGIEKLLQGLNPNKACGIDEISPRILKLASHEIAPI